MLRKEFRQTREEVTGGNKVKALSGYAEWFWLMAKGWKDVENRNWSLYRYIKPSELPSRIYLHASKTPASEDELNFIDTILLQDNVDKLTEFHQVDWAKYRGAIIGETTIIGQCQAGEFAWGEKVSPWFFGQYGFWVKSGILYPNPIPYRGQLGFFDVKLLEN
jgi:hypothetical protein